MSTQIDYQKPHVFDPIHNGADECECGLTSGADIHESDEAYEERMRPRIVNAPERIWLQVGCDDEVGEIDWKELSHPDVSWCAERIDNTDIEYVRADLLATVRREEREAAFKEALGILSEFGRELRKVDFLAKLEAVAGINKRAELA